MSLTITDVKYGPPSLRVEVGQQASFYFMVVCDPPGNYPSITGTVKIYDESNSRIVQTLSNSFGPDGAGNYPCYLKWDGRDARGVTLPVGDYAPVFYAQGVKEKESKTCTSVACNGVNIPPAVKKREEESDCLAATCSPVQGCRFGPKSCTGGSCGEDVGGGSSDGSSMEPWPLLPHLTSESFSLPPIMLPSLSQDSLSLPPIMLPYLSQISFGPPPIILPAAMPPVSNQSPYAAQFPTPNLRA